MAYTDHHNGDGPADPGGLGLRTAHLQAGLGTMRAVLEGRQERAAVMGR